MGGTEGEVFYRVEHETLCMWCFTKATSIIPVDENLETDCRSIQCAHCRRYTPMDVALGVIEREHNDDH